MDRKALFDAIRPFAPAGRFTEGHVSTINGLADVFGLRREATPAAAPGGRRTLKDPGAFFASLRGAFGPLNQAQVDGAEALLSAMAAWPPSWAAYGLATAWHETGRTLQPIMERGGPAYFRRMYDIEGDRPAKARELGNRLPGDGARFAGRGYVQITGRANYARYGIADDPDRALRPDVAAHIMVDGMEKGVFTGRKLADYLPGDYVNARRIINGTDKAEEIAGHARKFEAALAAGGWG